MRHRHEELHLSRRALDKALEAAGHTLSSLAASMGVSRTTIQRYAAGVIPPEIVRHEIADRLGVAQDDLWIPVVEWGDAE